MILDTGEVLASMLLNVKKISFSYNPGKTVFKDISFSMNQGDIMTLLGPNGAGKSTLFDCLCRQKTPLTGEIRIDDIPIQKYKQRQLASVITLVTQNVNMVFNFLVRDYVVMGCAPRISALGKPAEKDYEEADKAMEELGVSDFAGRMFNQLSGGEQQQVTIAKAVAQRPKIILFDEPTSFLDVGNQQKVLRLIKKMASSGYAIIMTTHNPDHAIQLGGTCALLHPDGNMIAGSPESSLREEILAEVYNIPLKVFNIKELGRYACLAPALQ